MFTAITDICIDGNFFQPGDVVPDALASERIQGLDVLKYEIDNIQVGSPVTETVSKKKRKAKEILTENTSEISTSVDDQAAE